jgi:hypothetical protein
VNTALVCGAGPPDSPHRLLELLQRNWRSVISQQVCDTTPLVCGAERPSKPHERESRAMLCLILRRLSEIDAKLESPLTARQLHWRYCAKCGERVTNANCGGYEGRSALTGRLFCQLCVDEMD